MFIKSIFKEVSKSMKSKTSTYTVEFELITTFQDRYIINKKMKVAKSIYNACLNECLKRLKAVKADKEYHTPVSYTHLTLPTIA